ncbi:hypothetical protein V496_03695 [Pseudogymnoascus sp. VKM F-4515 (FW-2607)]|nr:hypothetical protein V496_03695 [Pseudogymnoascus sp. VKM F-4515 (FW-2607)]KFY91156.1 hypothetical protein V498_05662 [Pseudogymnoascus sp. VKM F-4517 (FW-2822)]
MTTPRREDRPQLGATFYPGGHDGFVMPELISPAPQRVMPEVPSNMQEGLAHLELEANNPQTVSPIQEQYGASRSITYQQNNAPQGYSASYEQAGAPNYQNNPTPTIRRDGDMPLPSPFPSLQNPGPNVPLTDDQMEEELEQCREKVVGSNDPERQLRWAQDALHWSDIAIQSRRRAAVGAPNRPTTPNVERRIRDDALNITKFLAEQGHPKAEFLRAGWYEFGKFGFPEDAKESFAGYKRAAERGYARAEYRIGTRYESNKDMPRAVKHYQNGVAQHDSASSYRMGMMALLGQHGQPQNFDVGVRQVKYAADTADENAPQGSYVYGMLLARELPNISLPDFALIYDLEQARHYVERAALLGFSKAQLKMGSAYELCLLGCEFNPTLSLHYNRLAASQGEPEAEMAISKWFLCGYSGVFEKNEEVAFTYAKRAAQQELPTAEFALGYFYEVGLHVPMDLGRSQEWYQKAADHGNTDAAARIDALRLHRTLSRKDHEQMAITRIRSQYGSRKGKRPDHLAQKVAAQQVPTLPAMSEERDDSSRPISVYPPRSSSTQPQQPPFRVITPVPDPNGRLSQQPPFRVITPVPGDIKHTGSMPSSPLQSHFRTNSGGSIGGPPGSAPYPENDVAHHPIQSNPNLRSISGPPADRPNSAFGIKPLHPNHSFGPGQEVTRRPMSAVGDLPSQQQRPHPGQGGRGQPVVPNQQRREGPTSNDWESQYRLPYSQPQVGDGRGKLQNQGAPSNKPYPQLPQAHGQQPQHLQPRNDYSQNRPNPADDRQSRTYSAQAPLKPHPGGQSADRPMSSAGKPHDASGAYPARYSSIPPGATGPAVTISPAPTPQVSKPQAPPPKKGPQTFEEMGVPAASKDSECLVM